MSLRLNPLGKLSGHRNAKRMSYTLYIPDTTRNQITYTTKTFADVKELAMWAVATAMNPVSVSVSVPVPVPAPAPEVVVSQPSVSVAQPAEEPQPTQQPTQQPIVWSVDTDSWFLTTDGEYDSPFAEPLRTRNWSAFSKIVIQSIKDTAFETVCTTTHVNQQLFDSFVDLLLYKHSYTASENLRQSITDSVTVELYRLFMTAVIENIESVAETVLPNSCVRWNCLPPAFKKHCLKHIAETQYVWESDNKFSRGESWYLLAKIPLSQNYLKLLKYFTTIERHSSWIHTKVETEQFKPLENPIECTNRVVKEWWTQQKPSDELREFMIKLIVVRSFKKTSETDFIGSSEFRDVYISLIPNLTTALPSFVEWATQSTSFAHCKKALGELGIPQARRAEGQRFTNLKLLDGSEPWEGYYMMMSGELSTVDAFDSGFDSVSGYSQSLLDEQFNDKSKEIGELWLNDIEAKLRMVKLEKEKHGNDSKYDTSCLIDYGITELELKKKRILSKNTLVTLTVPRLCSSMELNTST